MYQEWFKDLISLNMIIILSFWKYVWWMPRPIRNFLGILNCWSYRHITSYLSLALFLLLICQLCGVLNIGAQAQDGCITLFSKLWPIYHYLFIYCFSRRQKCLSLFKKYFCLILVLTLLLTFCASHINLTIAHKIFKDSFFLISVSKMALLFLFLFTIISIMFFLEFYFFLNNYGNKIIFKECIHLVQV